MDAEPQEPVKNRRRSVLVDPSMQWAAALAVGGVVAGFLILFSVTRFLRWGSDAADLTGEEAAFAAILWNGLSIAFVVVAVMVFMVHLTHRVAGAARVLEHAIDGLVEGDLERRRTLRRKDYLQRLATGVGRLAEKMKGDDAHLRAALDRIESALRDGDVGKAREAIGALRGERRAPQAVAERVSA
jgi:hypothetical protein